MSFPTTRAAKLNCRQCVNLCRHVTSPCSHSQFRTWQQRLRMPRPSESRHLPATSGTLIRWTFGKGLSRSACGEVQGLPSSTCVGKVSGAGCRSKSSQRGRRSRGSSYISFVETSKRRNTRRLIFQSAASLRVRTQSRKTHAPWFAGCSVSVLHGPCLSGVVAVWYSILEQVLTMADLPLLIESEAKFATGNRPSHARTTCSCHGRPELKPCRTAQFA